MKKKILLSSYMYGNMEALIEYFNEHLSKMLGDKIELEFIDMYKIDKMKKMRRYFHKFVQRLKTYDMVISDYASPILKTGKQVIFMDHGYGLKCMPGLDEIKDSETLELGRLVRESDYIVTLSKRDEEYFYNLPELKKFKKPNYISLGQPRNDILFDEKFISNAKSDIKEKLNLNDEKIMLYAPTWRGYDVTKEFPFTRNDFENLNSELQKLNWKFLYRPHYIENIIPDEFIEGLSNIKKIGVDIEPFTQKVLAAVDMVITDYSSIIVDYLIMQKPIAFIPFDEKRYDDYRGLVVDFENDIETPGPKINTMEEFISYIKDIESGKDDFKVWRTKAQEYYYAYFDNKSTERIWELILQCLNIGQAARIDISEMNKRSELNA
jgi:CDP-glycerol glycerophosphotransferase (TagB/SpsB family)